MPDPLPVHSRSDTDGASALKGLRLSAGLVWPVSSPPIQNGAVLVGSDGRIQDVGPDDRVARPEGVFSLALPGILLPGLVNVHTHLELTGFAGEIQDPAFFDWIQHVRRAKARATLEEFVADARDGIREAWAGGVTTVADTGDSGAAARALHELGGRGIVYQEVFGPDPRQLEESFRGLMDALSRLAPFVSSTVRLGVSPHSLYTVSAPLFRKVADFARAEDLPIAVHLAESLEETALVTQGTGPFAEMWQRREIPLPEPARSPLSYLDRAGVLGPNLLAIHVIQTDEEDRGRLRDSGTAVALCPRSNATHRHGSPPARFYLGTVRTGLGTDSAASLHPTDLFAEARAIRELAQPEPADLVKLLTLDGAAAIGMDREIGSLEKGKWADMVHLNLPGGREQSRGLAGVAGLIVDASPAQVTGTWVAGRRVYGSEDRRDRV